MKNGPTSDAKSDAYESGGVAYLASSARGCPDAAQRCTKGAIDAAPGRSVLCTSAENGLFRCLSVAERCAALTSAASQNRRDVRLGPVAADRTDRARAVT